MSLLDVVLLTTLMLISNGVSCLCRRPIHRSAWKVNSGKLASTILYKLLPERPPGRAIHLRTSAGRSQDVVVSDKDAKSCTRSGDAPRRRPDYEQISAEASPPVDRGLLDPAGKDEPPCPCEPLAPDERCQLQLLGLFAGHLPPQGARVLACMELVLGARDREGVPLRDQPVQGHLGWLFVVGLAYLAEDVYHRLDLLEVLLAEGSPHTPHEARGPVATRAILAGKEAFSDGAVGDERHAQSPAHFEHPVCLRCPLQQAVLYLVRGERHPVRGEPVVRPLHLVRAVVADAHPANFARLDRLREGIHQAVYVENRVVEVDLV